ncbi:Long-chain-fatty-acid--CoA ligase [compost metagenome]
MNSFLSHRPLEVPVGSFAGLFLERIQHYADNPALIDGLSGEQLTYAELSRHVRVLAANLIERGLEPGEVTAIIAPNSIWFPVALYGIAFAGGVYSTLNPMSSPEDVRELLKLVGATRVIVTPQVFERLRDTLSTLQLKEIFVLGESAGLTPFASLLVGKPLAEERCRDLQKDLLALMFSSGTSGFPKAVMLSNRNYVAATEQVTAAQVFRKSDTILAALPFFHIYGQTSFIGSALSQGARLIVLPALDLEVTLRVIQDYKITVAPVVAPVVLQFAKHPLVDHFDLSSLRLAISGASPISADLLKSAADRLKVPVLNGWGLTESTTTGAVSEPGMPKVAEGSVGRVMHGIEVRVVEIGGNQDVAPGADGELLIRGPNVMLGYFNNPAATAETIDAQGWLRTGDVGRLDEHGNLRIIDRAKEFIKFKGFQISPVELESVLLMHPAVADAGVVPSPDTESGEVPKAFVVLRSPVTEAELIDFVAQRVTPYKKLRDIEFIDAIPKNPAGKILRRILVLREREKRETHAASGDRLEDRVVITRHGNVLSICLDRPRKMNAFDRDMFIGLAKAMAIYEDDPSLRCAVLHANGLVFTSGMDIVSTAPLAARGELRIGDPSLVDMLEIDPAVRRRSKPVVLAVHGKCMNLGVELAAAADIVIAAQDVTFIQREVAVGLFPFGGATVFLPAKIGLGNALRYILTAEEFDAQSACRMGLVQEVVPQSQLMTRAFEFARLIAQNSPSGVKAALASVRLAREKGPEAALATLLSEVARLTGAEDFKEGAAAFLEKRAPNFKDA